MSHARWFRRNRGCANPQSPLEFTLRTSSCRTLTLEGLETRLALSTVAEGNLDPCPTVEAEPEIVESTSPAELSIDGGTAEEGAEFVGPLEVDAYFESITWLESTAVAAEGEEASIGAPMMLSFDGDRNSNYWVLTGTVVDDINPANCRVYFDGILNGQSTPVMPDGTFWYYTNYIPGITTMVNAVARDGQGNESNVMSVVLS